MSVCTGAPRQVLVDTYPTTGLSCQDWGRTIYVPGRATSNASNATRTYRCTYSTEHRKVTYEYIQPGHGTHNHPAPIAGPPIANSPITHLQTIKISG